MTDSNNASPNRREFVKSSLAGAVALSLPAVAPIFIPRTYLFGAATPPSRVLNVAQIGCGRMGMEDLRGIMAHDLCRIVAVCDLDDRRLTVARLEVEQFYRAKGEQHVTVGAYNHYRDVLERADIDAVLVTTPDHWHARVAIDAVNAGKDVHVQKPITYSIAESVALRDAVHRSQRIVQTGSQQRSSKPWNTFRVASEAVRNGRVGRLHTIRIGIGQDQPKGMAPLAQPIPSTFDYANWLGPVANQPYTEDRVHPQSGYGRPGWITTEDFGLGMITNWGAHHIDIAHWAMGMELSGPSSVQAHADFMHDDVWTVHHTYHVEMLYPNGVRVILDQRYPNGIRFEGSDGWVFCARGNVQVTSSDPTSGNSADARSALDASRPAILSAPYSAHDKRWPASDNHYRNWLESINSRTEPIAPVDQGVRSLQACAIAWISMKLDRRVEWDPTQEQFMGDAQANAMRARLVRT